MSMWNYPEIGEIKFRSDADKDKLLSSYLRYYLARLQSMFKWSGLPDTIPQKWLENLLLVHGAAVFVKTEKDGLFVNRPAPASNLDVYYIPQNILVVNPYAHDLKDVYHRDQDCVLMLNDTYAQGLIPMLRKYCTALTENYISLTMSSIMSRATMILSAADDKTKQSAEVFIKHLLDGKLDVIGETPFLVANQDKALSVNQMTRANDTITQLIEYHQYIKASLYNELGLQSNYNMKRESINSKESQLNEDQLHPLIDNMLAERKEAAEKVNAMFGTNITVEFNSAWEINEKQEETEIERMEAETETAEAQADIAEAQAEIAEIQAQQAEENPEEVPEDAAPEEVPEEAAEDTEEKDDEKSN